MSYQQDRDQFIDRMSREGLPLRVTLALLRASTTLNRYAELACSSEAADRDRVPCPATRRPGAHIPALHPPTEAEAAKYPCLCDDYPAGSHAAGRHSDVPRYRVAEARLEARIAGLLAEVTTDQRKAAGPAGNALIDPWIMDTQGDPRGYVLRVIPPSYAERNAGRDRCNRDVIGVPCRESGIKW